MGKREKRCYDGYLVNPSDPVVMLMPHIMPRRTDSQVQTEVHSDLDKVEAFIREHKKTDIPELTLYHFVFAAIARAAFEFPQCNRFVKRYRLWERRHVKISMMVKTSLSTDAKESSISPILQKDHTLKDIVDIIQREASVALDSSAEENGFDKLVGILGRIPQFVIRMFIGLMIWLENMGCLPKALQNIQPFHCSFFVTNLGSIGLPPLYHHLYEFGTCSGFITMGSKQYELKVNPDGTVKKHKVLPLNFVGDSRICDGYTYSCMFRALKKCFEHPEILLESFEESKNK